MELLVIVGITVLVLARLRRGDRGRRPGGSSGSRPIDGWVAGATWKAVKPLARAESRRVARHPVFIAGLVLTPLVLAAATDGQHSWWGLSASLALGLVPLGWLTIVATNLVALAPRRNGSEELLTSLPAPQPVRTVALLATAWVPVITGAAALTAWSVALATTRGDLLGRPRPLELAAGLLILAGSSALGVAVARWLPGSVWGVVAALATIVLQARFLDVATWPWNRTEADPHRFLGFLAATTGTGDPALEIRPAAWHLAYLAGLVVLMAAAALAASGRSKPVMALLGAGCLAVAVSGVAQTRPPSPARLDAMADYLTHPEEHQRCTTGPGGRYCAYPGFDALASRWRRQVTALRTELPAAARDRPLRVVQRPAPTIANRVCGPQPFTDALPPGMSDRLEPSALWPSDDDVHPGYGTESFPCSDDDGNGIFSAVQLGLWAVGLPSSSSGHHARCRASGQARSVAALWLGAAITPEGSAQLRRLLDEGRAASGLLSLPGWDDPPAWGVQFSTADVEAALALAQRPRAEIGQILRSDWSRWTDPDTTTAELTAGARLAASDPPGTMASTASTPCP